MTAKKILITGGAGYIGSHTCVELLNAGHDLVVVDNLTNSKFEALARVQRITGRALTFHQVDVRDKQALREVFALYAFEAVSILQGLKRLVNQCSNPCDITIVMLVGLLSFVK